VCDVNGLDGWMTGGLRAWMFPCMDNSGSEIAQAPGYVVIRLELIHETRIVPLDGRPALDPAIKQWLGDSRGRFDGDTLVIESTNFNGDSPMTIVGPGGKPIPTSGRLPGGGRLRRATGGRIGHASEGEDPMSLTQ